MSLWVIRHVAKLRELLTLAGQPDTAPIPDLPALVVQGYDWTSLFSKTTLMVLGYSLATVSALPRT
jgi:hypothetical protein